MILASNAGHVSKSTRYSFRRVGSSALARQIGGYAKAGKPRPAGFGIYGDIGGFDISMDNPTLVESTQRVR